MKKQYCLTLDIKLVEEVREQLVVGQSLSPILNMLLENWMIKKRKEVVGGQQKKK